MSKSGAGREKVVVAAAQAAAVHLDAALSNSLPPPVRDGSL